MNNPNPLIPQGSLMEQKAKSRQHLRVALVIVAVHLIFLGGLLIQGCKPETEPEGDQFASNTETNEEPDFGVLDVDKLYPPQGALEPEPRIEPPPPAFSNRTDRPALDTNRLGFGLRQPTDIEPLRPSTTNQAGTNPPVSVVEPPEEPAEEPAGPAMQEHTVKAGESFYSIATRYGIPVQAVVEANSTVEPQKLQIGQKLQIPVGAPTGRTTTPPDTPTEPGVEIYTVKAGDTLTKIGRAYGTTAKRLQEMNNLPTAGLIRVGQKLKVPSRGGGQ